MVKIKNSFTQLWSIFTILVFAALVAFIFFYSQARYSEKNQILLERNLEQQVASASSRIKALDEQVATLEAEPLRVKDQQILSDLSNLKAVYKSAMDQYEQILLLQEQPAGKLTTIDNLFAAVLSSLSQDNYKLAQDNLQKLSTEITKEKTRLANLAPANIETIPVNVPAKSTPPASGYSRQKVSVGGLGDILVDIVAADLSSTKVIVDTASGGTCMNDCPVLPLATYVSRGGAYAGINGSYFCPTSYPSCAGKTNSFDLLVMNKDKVYFNSDNNVYSNNPGVVFGSGYIRFLTAVSQWGRDTSIDGMISNFPLLVFNGSITFGGNSDSKQTIRTSRGFVANKGNTVYIGIIHGVSTAESAMVLKTMGMDNALNLDDAGSAALWSGGYKVGPGRDLPNVILFVRK